jgi:hypothetical protein
MSDIKRETTRKKYAKKGASKKKGHHKEKGAVRKKKGVSKKKSATSGQRLLARDMSSTTASLMRTATAWRADTRRRRKEEVPGYDPGVWDIPGHFEEVRRPSRFGHFIEAPMLSRSSVFGPRRKTTPFFMMAVGRCMPDRTMHTF